MVDVLNLLTCPVCNSPLVREGGSLVCVGGERRHTYDIARSGYVNLLPPGRGRNAKTGDDSDMVRARVSFLSRGYYDRLSDEAARLIDCYGRRDECLKVADSGCGEGYHTVRVANLLTPPLSIAAFDASKYASEAASKRAYSSGLSPKGGLREASSGDRSAAFMTGNIFSLPLAASSLDAVLSMFAPIAWGENRRILRGGGVIVVAASGRDHLIELRNIIYDEVIKKESSIVPVEGFVETARTNVKYKVHLPDAESIGALFQMTPFCHRTSDSAASRLALLDELNVTVDVDFYVFEKSANE